MQFPLPVDQDKSIAAQAVHHGFGNVHHRGHSDCGIGGIAAVLQYLQTDLSSKRLARSTMPCDA
jgi:hypothetical protein